MTTPIFSRERLFVKVDNIVIMVEGPGCKIKGERIKGKLLKQRAITVAGNAVDREKKVNKKQASDKWDVTSFHRLIGQNLDEVLTLGKELFMFFGDGCLRVHFLMAGSFRVNGNVLDKDGGKLAAQPSLEIQFSTDHLSFYKCAVEIRPSSACKQKYELMKELDICSASFNLKRAAAEIMRESERQLCDVLLDQDILPGVGNIIKNEALFDSGLRPDSKVKDLTEEHLFHLVKMTRDFSSIFYKCRSTGTNLSEHMKVYQKNKCCECGTKITMTTLGEDNRRVSFFCPKCQTNDLRKLHKLKIPAKNSLLGWVQKGSSIDSPEWICSMCTLLNPGKQINCIACFEPRIGHSGRTPDQSLISARTDRERAKKPVLKKRKLNQTEGTESTKTVEQMPVLAQSISSFQERPESNSSMPKTEKGICGSKIPACSGHGKKCSMKQTFKDNKNKGRWFFVCAVTPARKQCKFFKVHIFEKATCNIIAFHFKVNLRTFNSFSFEKINTSILEAANAIVKPLLCSRAVR